MNFEQQLHYWTHMLDEAFPNMLTEGDHWPEDFVRKAYNQVKQSPLGQTAWYKDQYIQQDLNTMAKEYQDAELTHTSKQTNMFKTIVKWFIQYSGTSPQAYQNFIEQKFDYILLNLKLIFSNQELFDKIYDSIRNQMTFAQFEEYCNRFEQERNASQQNKMQNFVERDNGYQLIKIDSYDQLNQMFGGTLTGDGKNASTGWCHTNGESTYNAWTEKGRKRFFILCKKNWKDIAPTFENATDEYGSSAIALLVSNRTAKLYRNTFRYNHVVEPTAGSVDNCVEGYADLSYIAGFDVKKKIADILGVDPDAKFDISQYFDGTNFNCSKADVESLEGSPKEVKGNFDCSNTSITSFEHAPVSVGGSFDGSYTHVTSCKHLPQYIGKDLILTRNHLDSLVGCPKKIGGSFIINQCFGFKSLEGCPQEVGGQFMCVQSGMNSLIGAPKIINGDFSCKYCLGKMTTLKGAPMVVKGTFDCEGIRTLTSLVGAPQEVGGDFNCCGTEITTLEGSPKIVGGDFLCNCGNLSSLAGAPVEIGGRLLCKWNNGITKQQLTEYRRFLKNPTPDHIDETGHYKP